MTDYERAVSLMEQSSIRKRFAGPRPADLVDAAEKALGVAFPPTYRRFLLEYGAGGFGGFEVYGVTGPNFEKGTVPNGIWYTLDERLAGLPPYLVIIRSLGDGGLNCLDLRPEHCEGPVIVYYPGSETVQPKEIVALDFGAFLLDQVQQHIERRSRE